MSIAADHIPNKICTVRTMDKPWMANNIRNQISKRRRYHKKQNKQIRNITERNSEKKLCY